MEGRVYNVLFVCMGNSARSILAEALLNQLGQGRFRAFSGGGHPTGSVDPLAVETLRRLNLPTEGYSSKDWSVFAGPDARPLDFVFTVGDTAAGEACPVWPGQPLTAHWGVTDPLGFEGPLDRRRKTFYDMAVTLRRRIELFLSLPISRLDRSSLQSEVRRIGTVAPAPTTQNLLILCTHNSARSILAEAMVNHLAERTGVDVRAYSAGSTPSGQVNPMALQVLQDAGVPVQGLRSKSWDDFARDGAPRMRAVLTVCDQAAAEPCPFWPGVPIQAHWGYPDPSNVTGAVVERRNAFDLTRQALGYRLSQLIMLPLEAMSDDEMREALERIGRS